MKKIISLLITLIPLITFSQAIFINEIHYDNAGGDVNEGIEIAGPAGSDLTGYSLTLYNGNGGSVYNTISLSGSLNDQQNGFGTLFFPISGIQNGSPDGVALVNPSNEVIQFLSYEGTLTASDGPASGLTSIDIGISEASSTPIDFSLQLTGSGQSFESFTWVADVSTFGTINAGQSFGDDPDPDPEPTIGNLFINEIHYDNTGSDVDEGVEVAGAAGLDLNGWSIVLYNGNGGAVYNTIGLSGLVPDQNAGFGTKFFAISGLQNGAPDGIALVAPGDSLIQFISYEGTFTAVGGPADGISSEDIGVSESSSSFVGFSLQLEGTGSEYNDFTWAASAASTYDLINTNQTFSSPIPQVFINEFHYDNASTDTNEGVEVAGTAGVDLSSWSLVLYNGNGGAVYNTVSLNGSIPDQDNGYGTLSFGISGIQNGGPDGIALVAPGDSLVQFLSYEGSFVGVGGAADGIMSEDIGQAESSSTPAGFSLQLQGIGQMYTDFVWGEPQANTFGLVNAGQSFGDSIIVPPPTSDTVSIAQARQLALNSEVVVKAVFTVTDQFGGPVYLQDSTAGIALFDPSVHGDGLFNIGDEVWISASIGQFNGQVQLVDVDSIVLIDSAVTIVAPVVNLDQLTAYEGQLVTVSGISFEVSEGVLFPNTNYNISDGTGTEQVRIDGNTNLVGRNRPVPATSITAVVGRFNANVQLLPRFEQDLPGTTPFEPGGSDIPFEETFDVATWNMEFFGTTIQGFGPSDVALQASNASTVLMNLNADIIAVQEVSNDSLLQIIVDEMTNYALVCSDVYSRSFQEPDPNNPFPPQKLCFIYNTVTVSPVSDRAIFDEFYTQARLGQISDLDDYPTSSGASSFWSSGRLPYQLIADVNIQGVTQRVNLINIHAKSGSGSSDLARRVYDNTALKDTLDAFYPNDAIILLGDYNDDIDVSIGGGPSTYEVILNDTSNYDAISRTLSENNTPTFIGGSGSTIDHITISSELFSDIIEGSESIYFPFNVVENYEFTTSDHLPVVARFDLIDPLTTSISEEQTTYFGYDPAASAVLEVSASGGVAPYNYIWSTGETTSSITVSPVVSTSYTVVITDARGIEAIDSTRVAVEDVRCRTWGKRPKVEVCYRGRNLCVPDYVAERLIVRGASLGACSSSEEPTLRLSGLTVFPNPVLDKLTLKLNSSMDAEIEVKIRSFYGEEVVNQTIALNEGANEIMLQLSHLKRGFYVLKVKAKTGSYQRALILVKK